MARGDQIYVMRPLLGLTGVYEHHGIDCGDGTVIHYSKTEPVATVRRTSLAAFTMGNPVFVKSRPTGYIPDVVVQRAESRLGEQAYNLIANNCEHFANWCKTGVNHSDQVESYGLGGLQLGAYDSSKLVEEAARTGNIQQAIALFEHAYQNIAIARQQVQAQYDHEQKEVHSWHRVALTTLKKGEEGLTRSALERKVKHKKQAAALKAQLDQLAVLNDSLNRNRAILQQRQAGELS
jgi:Lecithin retinol acyltransferase